MLFILYKIYEKPLFLKETARGPAVNILTTNKKQLWWWWFCVLHLFQQTSSYMTMKSLCWGFTAQSTQWGHVERGQFT